MKHIVHFFEILESLLFEELIKKTNPLYQAELTKEQMNETKTFFNCEKKFIPQFNSVVARLCIRNLRDTPRIDQNLSLY